MQGGLDIYFGALYLCGMEQRTPIQRAAEICGSPYKLAKAVGVSHQRIYQIIGGGRPSPDLAAKIEAAVAGKVTKSALLWGDEGGTNG